MLFRRFPGGIRSTTPAQQHSITSAEYPALFFFLLLETPIWQSCLEHNDLVTHSHLLDLIIDKDLDMAQTAARIHF